MSTSYSSRSCAKLFCLLSTILSLSESKSKTSSHRIKPNSPITKPSHSTTTTTTTNTIKTNPIQFESMCSMCFLDDNKLKTCSRCLSRILSMLAVDRNKCSMCVDKLYVDIKIGGSSRMKEVEEERFSSVSFRLNDFHLANLCLFIFIASLVFLYKNQPLSE